MKNEPNPISGHPARPPSGRAAAVRRVGRVFAAAGYNQRNIAELLGPANAGKPAADLRDQWLRRTRDRGPLSTLVRLFAMGEPVSATAAAAAFSPMTVDQFAALGLVVNDTTRVWPAVQILAESNLVLASDLHPNRGAPASGHVLGVTRSAIALERLLVPGSGGTALDLATGMGMIALHMAPQAETVVATDIAPRALAFARFNAALNGISNVRVRRSDGFEQLRGTVFDRIAGNLPFVVSPSSDLVYRDAGAAGDDFFASILQACSDHLKEGGFAQFMGQWIESGGAAEERLRERLAGAGCDIWMMRFSRQAPDEYASEWILPSSQIGARERARQFDDWMGYYEKTGVEAIHTGLWTLQRRSSRAGHWFISSDHALPPENWGRRIHNGFSALARWYNARARRRLAALRLRVAKDVSLREESRWNSDRPPALSLVLPDGITPPFPLDLDAAAWLSALDGRRTLAQVWAQMAGEASDPPEPWLDRIHNMLLSGCLEIA